MGPIRQCQLGRECPAALHAWIRRCGHRGACWSCLAVRPKTPPSSARLLLSCATVPGRPAYLPVQTHTHTHARAQTHAHPISRDIVCTVPQQPPTNLQERGAPRPQAGEPAAVQAGDQACVRVCTLGRGGMCVHTHVCGRAHTRASACIVSHGRQAVRGACTMCAEPLPHVSPCVTSPHHPPSRPAVVTPAYAYACQTLITITGGKAAALPALHLPTHNLHPPAPLGPLPPLMMTLLCFVQHVHFAVLTTGRTTSASSRSPTLGWPSTP